MASRGARVSGWPGALGLLAALFLGCLAAEALAFVVGALGDVVAGLIGGL